MSKCNKLIVVVLFVVLIALIIWIIWGNTALVLSNYRISSTKLPEEFSGFRIVQVSDLHNAKMGQNNSKLLAMIKDTQPNIIVITGDLIDSRKTDLDTAVAFAQSAVQIAPCYYVTGNHESRVAVYSTLKEKLIETGVTILDDASYTLNYSGADISLIGINDPAFYTDYLIGDEESSIKNSLNSIEIEKDQFQLLLSHRPEYIHLYATYGIDLVLSGHAHGGQFRLPFIGGVYAPNQGLFPEYNAGIHTFENTSMIISRGIGNSLFPFRINNRPEVIVVELVHQ